jgi:carbamoyltransferase
MTVKNREEFLPLAPAVTTEEQAEYFDSAQPSSFMSRAVPVRSDRVDLLSELVHADGTARIQSVDRRDNPTFHALLRSWGDACGLPVLLNTSLNVRGQPIACSVTDALATFFGCSLDCLYIDRFSIRK